MSETSPFGQRYPYQQPSWGATPCSTIIGLAPQSARRHGRVTSNVRPPILETTKLLSQSLELLRERVSACEEGFAEFILATDFPKIYEELEQLQSTLEKLGIFELLWAAVGQAEDMLRSERVEDAEHTLLRAIEDLAGASPA